MIIRKHLFVLTFAASALAATGSAFAQDKTPGSGPNPYTDCGIGAALFSNTKWAAVTSNVIWDAGTTALTSATSSPQTCSGKKVETALFIRDTFGQLVEQTAAGQGEHLTTALGMFGCGATQQSAAASEVRNAMSQTVSAPGYAARSPIDKAAAYYSIMDQAARQHCAA